MRIPSFSTTEAIWWSVTKVWLWFLWFCNLWTRDVKCWQKEPGRWHIMYSSCCLCMRKCFQVPRTAYKTPKPQCTKVSGAETDSSWGACWSGILTEMANSRFIEKPSLKKIRRKSNWTRHWCQPLASTHTCMDKYFNTHMYTYMHPNTLITMSECTRVLYLLMARKDL